MPKQAHHGTSLLDMRARRVLVMTKLKTALSFSCLAILFQISPSTCIRIFKGNVISTWACTISYNSGQAEKTCAVVCHFALTSIKKLELFRLHRIVTEKPKCLNCRILKYSHYYGTHTIKLLVSVSPAGAINFISKAYRGRASDKVIFEQSGLLDKLETYIDDVMVDKGFCIEQECLAHSIDLVCLPF